MQCNCTLRSDEIVCFTCGTAKPDRNPKKAFGDRFKTIVNVFFILFAVLTVLSLFTDYVPSFYKCISGLVILFLVKNSADNMVENKKS